jgi:hypothetical protein
MVNIINTNKNKLANPFSIIKYMKFKSSINITQHNYKYLFNKEDKNIEKI